MPETARILKGCIKFMLHRVGVRLCEKDLKSY